MTNQQCTQCKIRQTVESICGECMIANYRGRHIDQLIKQIDSLRRVVQAGLYMEHEDKFIDCLEETDQRLRHLADDTRTLKELK